MGQLIIILMLLSTNLLAMGNNSAGGTWVNDWWASTFSSVQAQQVQEAKDEESSCDKKLKKYKDKVDKRPKNKYYLWRYETWKQQCDEERLKSLTSP